MPVTTILGSTIFHEESGEGRAFVFLHGNPTSSYVWRNVLPRVEHIGRLLAPDLIGMGKSGKPDIAYSFDDHARCLAAWPRRRARPCRVAEQTGMTDVPPLETDKQREHPWNLNRSPMSLARAAPRYRR